MSQFDRAVELRDEILAAAPPEVLKVVSDDKWAAAVLWAEEYYKKKFEASMSNQEKLANIIRKCSEISVFKDKGKLYDLLVYMFFTIRHLHGAPMQVIVSKYDIKYDQLQKLVELFGLKTTKVLGEHEVIIEPYCADGIFKYEGKQIHDGAFGVVREAAMHGYNVLDVLIYAQNQGWIPASIYTYKPILAMSVTLEILEGKRRWLNKDEFKNARNIFSDENPMLLLNGCVRNPVGTDSYYLDTRNPVILPYVELNRFLELAATTDDESLGTIFGIPTWAVHHLLEQKVHVESLQDWLRMHTNYVEAPTFYIGERKASEE